MRKYLIRLDDACPYMDRDKWQRMEEILDRYGVKPLVGIIPANTDPQTMIEQENHSFWEKAHSWEKKGWQIALHGYDHVCISDGGMQGLNPFWKRSEFAGVPLEQQREKIKKGLVELREHGFDPKYFFAPSHTFDENTLEALRLESDIRIISDTIAIKPYQYKGFVFIPQVGGHCSEMKIPGIWTFCLHPNTMKEEAFLQTERFLQEHKDEFISFDQLDFENIGKKDIFSRLLSLAYFTRRKLLS